MRSTAYVIELVIAGAGAILWLALLGLTLFGYEWMPIDYLMEPGVILVLSPFVYVIGVILDRIVDNLFDNRFKENYTNPLFLGKEEYLKARTRIYLSSEGLQNLLEYGKMRIRICRAWAFNSLMILISGSLFVLIAPIPLPFWPDKVKFLVAIVLFFGLSALLSFRAWRTLSIKEAEYLRMQSKILEDLTQA